MKKNLIVLRNGNESLHEKWLRGENNNWDIMFCPFYEQNGISFYSKGQKWSGLYKFLSENFNWLNYDYICFPDDDIETDSDTWNDFFDFCSLLKIKLSAPALTKDSYFLYPITMQNENFQARKTSFVEIMNPCFSVDFLKKSLRTFGLSETGTGFGLDFLWPAMLNYEDIWIIDKTPVKHTKPIGRQRDLLLRALSNYEANFFIDLGIPIVYSCMGGIMLSGLYEEYNDNDFLQKYKDGYSYLKSFRMDIWPAIENLQFLPQKPILSHFDDEKLFKVLTHFDVAKKTISYKKPASQSSVSKWSWINDVNIEASGGNDGLINGLCGFHTDFEPNPWWRVDLENVFHIECVVIYNRLDMKERFVDFSIFSSLDGENYEIIFKKEDGKLFGGFDGLPYVANFHSKIRSRFIKIVADNYTCLHLDQVDVFGHL